MIWLLIADDKPNLVSILIENLSTIEELEIVGSAIEGLDAPKKISDL